VRAMTTEMTATRRMGGPTRYSSALADARIFW
jgi:hypothetical protein